MPDLALVRSMHPDILPLHAAIEAGHWWFVARRRIVRRLLVRVEPPEPNKVILDLGCGTGGNLGSLAHLYDCIGIERDPEAVRFASERYATCRFQRASIFEPEAWHLDELVDVCLIMDVLEHLDDDRTAVSNAISVLRPGGHLLITVPADPSLWSRHDRHHDHRRRYTLETLGSLLDPLPLYPRLLSYFNARLYYPIRAFRWLQNRFERIAHEGTTGNLTAQPAWVNRFLTYVFLGESVRLLSALDEPRQGYARGVSLIALYRKTEAP